MDAKLRCRLGYGALLIGLLVAALWLDETVLSYPWGATALLVLFTLAAQRETIDLLARAGCPAPSAPLLIAGAGILASRVFFLSTAPASPGLAWLATLSVAATLAVVLALGSPSPKEGARRFVGATLSLSLVVALSFLLDVAADHGTRLVFALVLTTKAGDIGGYFVGRTWGKTKLIPHVSPNKSVEGAVGGLVLSLLVALALFGRSAVLAENPVGLHWAACLALGAVVFVAGVLGDLIESVLKRAAGAKDSGQVIPEFGGALDMVDSLLLAAPVGAAALALLL